ncbi:MAG: hypothetical protein VCA39_16120 [Pseudomonas sp.]|uniref:hypothetical protein n=1 Tax=Pseudomonas sp. TaxID=306 RepID=UPI0039822FCD
MIHATAAMAEEEYQALSSYYSGPEAAYRYALLLRSMGRQREVREMQQQIQTYARRAPKHYRILHKEWLELSQLELRSLQQD